MAIWQWQEQEAGGTVDALNLNLERTGLNNGQKKILLDKCLKIMLIDVGVVYGQKSQDLVWAVISDGHTSNLNKTIEADLRRRLEEIVCSNLQMIFLAVFHGVSFVS